MSEHLSTMKSSTGAPSDEATWAALTSNAMAQYIDTDPDRIQAIVHLIELALSGTALVDLQRLFKENLGFVTPLEFSYSEQLIMQSSSMGKSSDSTFDALIHLFRPSLMQCTLPKMPPGHPASNFSAEGRSLRTILDSMRAFCAKKETGGELSKQWWRDTLTRLRDVDIRFRRKEKLIFPRLARKGFTRPERMMKRTHVHLMGLLDKCARELEYGEAAAFRVLVESMVQDFSQLLFKEDKVLCPTCIALFDQEDWVCVREAEEEAGWAFIDPPPAWPATDTKDAPAQAFSDWANAFHRAALESHSDNTETQEQLEQIFRGIPRQLPLPVDVGQISLDQLSLVFKHLPIDVTFTDGDDHVLFYNEWDGRIYKRGPRVIGRDMRLSHPPKSRPEVDRVMGLLRSGEEASVDFVRDFDSRRVLVRYIAVRDAEGHFRGVLNLCFDLGELEAVQAKAVRVKNN
jgi:uncharacterized protein